MILPDEMIRKLQSERDKLKNERDKLQAELTRLRTFRCVNHGGEIPSVQSGPCGVCHMPTTGRPGYGVK